MFYHTGIFSRSNSHSYLCFFNLFFLLFGRDESMANGGDNDGLSIFRSEQSRVKQFLELVFESCVRDSDVVGVDAAGYLVIKEYTDGVVFYMDNTRYSLCL